MRKTLIALLISIGCTAAFAQVDNTVYAKQFQGSTVGFKVAAAMGSCNASTSLQCFIVLDPSLNTWPTGTLPSLPGYIHLIDYRSGLPWGSGSGNITGSATGTTFCLPFWTGGTVLGNSPICYDSGTGSQTATVTASNSIQLNAPFTYANGRLLLNPVASGGSNQLSFVSSTTSMGVGLSITSMGSGYIQGQNGSCTVNGGTFTVKALCAAVGGPSGQLNFAIVNPGVYTVAPTSLSFSGFTSGSGLVYSLSLNSGTVNDVWAESSAYGTLGAGQEGSYFTLGTGEQKQAGREFFQYGSFPLQTIGSWYQWEIPKPNLLGETILSFDMDQVTSAQQVHWPNSSGTPMLSLVTGGTCGSSTFTNGVLTVTCTASGAGIGSITWALPSWLTASPATLSSGGTQTFSPTTAQTSHQVIGTCGSATTFGPCALVAADIPTLNQSTTGTAANVTATANSTLTSLSSLSLPYSQLTGTPTIIADTTITIGTSAIGANTCSSASTATMTGVASTSTFALTPNVDVSSTTGWSAASGGQLYFTAWPTSNTLNYKICNPTGLSITPGASTTWNVSAR